MDLKVDGKLITVHTFSRQMITILPLTIPSYDEFSGFSTN